MRKARPQLSFPHWDATLLPRPLSLPEVQAIYDRLDWSFVDDEVRGQDRCSGKFNPISMYKALVLPFLTAISSEADLARRIEESVPYRTVCGFLGRSPTRAMFWHFRNAPLPGDRTRRRKAERDEDPEKNAWFYRILHKLLITIAIVGERMDVNLPFVDYDNATVQVEASNNQIDVSTFELPHFPRRQFRVVHRTVAWFPAYVAVSQSARDVQAFALRCPPWWRKRASQREDLGRREPRSPVQYTACSAIILSRDRKRILLGRRKRGYGQYLFALPGGITRPGERLAKCIRREVSEETSLTIVKDQPVSISRNRYEEDDQDCWSVGVLVTEFEGEPTVCEPERCEGWDWYDVKRLPRPLFPPTKVILDHWREDRFPNASWERIEDWLAASGETGAQPPKGKQLRLSL